ncbi:MAG: electron transfer flavoprotein subunit beta/FixA family protein [Anaerolineae bacterium]
MRIVVCTKQVVDPLTPLTSLELDLARMRVLGPPNNAPVINGFDEQALEAALRLQETAGGDCEVIALAAGDRFALDVMKRSLAAGADELVLVEDAALNTWDSDFLARVLVAAIEHLGGADLILCGRQASDWDNAQVPLLMAEMLGWTCLTLAREVTLDGRRVRVERVLSDGLQTMEGDLPAVVTVTSELGELRYPTARARLQAARRRPRYLSLEDLGLAPDASPAVDVRHLSLLDEGRDCHFVEGADGVEAGRRLAAILLENGLVNAKRAEGN